MKLEIENNRLYLIYNNHKYWTCVKYKIKESYIGISFVIIEGSKIEFDTHIVNYPFTPLREKLDEENIKIRIKINRYSYGEKIEIYPKEKDRENLLKDLKTAFTLLK